MELQQQAILLRQLGPQDAAWLRSIAIKAYSEHYAETWYDGGAWYIRNFFSLARLQNELEDSNALFFGIQYKHEAMGFLKLNLDAPLTAESNALELERIYLVKNAAGKGIGTYVMHNVFELARKANKKLVWLKVMDTSPDAVRFYIKMGFEICGTHQVDFVQKKEGMRGMYVMQKRL